MKRAIIVTDMLNDFIREGGALELGEAGRAIVPAVNQHIAEARLGGAVVMFVADHHSPNDPEFQLWPPHAVRHTEGAEIIAEMDRRPGDIFVPKTHYSAYYNTNLKAALKKDDITEVELVGVCTSICILFTAADLRNRDYPVTVYQDAEADFDPASHAFALRHLEKVLGCKVV